MASNWNLSEQYIRKLLKYHDLAIILINECFMLLIPTRIFNRKWSQLIVFADIQSISSFFEALSIVWVWGHPISELDRVCPCYRLISLKIYFHICGVKNYGILSKMKFIFLLRGENFLPWIFISLKELKLMFFVFSNCDSMKFPIFPRGKRCE